MFQIWTKIEKEIVLTHGSLSYPVCGILGEANVKTDRLDDLNKAAGFNGTARIHYVWIVFWISEPTDEENLLKEFLNIFKVLFHT